MRKRALRIRIVFGSKCECVSIAIHFAVGRIGLRVHVLREEQRAMPAYEEPPVLPGGSFFALCCEMVTPFKCTQKKMNGKYQVGSGRIVAVTHDTPFIKNIVINMRSVVNVNMRLKESPVLLSAGLLVL